MKIGFIFSFMRLIQGGLPNMAKSYYRLSYTHNSEHNIDSMIYVL